MNLQASSWSLAQLSRLVTPEQDSRIPEECNLRPGRAFKQHMSLITWCSDIAQDADMAGPGQAEKAALLNWKVDET